MTIPDTTSWIIPLCQIIKYKQELLAMSDADLTANLSVTFDSTELPESLETFRKETRQRIAELAQLIEELS